MVFIAVGVRENTFVNAERIESFRDSTPAVEGAEPRVTLRMIGGDEWYAYGTPKGFKAFLESVLTDPFHDGFEL